MRLYLTGHMTHTMLRGAAALATLALVITSAPDADATVTLTTPGVQANGAQVSSCDIINIGKTAITLTVGLFNMHSGNPVSTPFNLCPVPPVTLAPGAGCAVQSATAGTQAYCVVTSSSSKVRAALSLLNFTTGAVEVEVPATK